MKASTKILIIRSSALGDVVHVLPALAALRHLFPAAEISWVVEPLGAALLTGHPDLHRLFVPPRQAWKRDLRNPLRWFKVLREVAGLTIAMRRERFDVVLDFQGNLRSAVTVLLAGGRRRVGFARQDVSEGGAALVTNLKAAPAAPRTNKVEKNLSLVRALGFDGACPRGQVHLEASDNDWATNFLADLAGKGPAIVMHPAVSRFGDFKRWPVRHYRTLIDLLRDQLDARIAITWGPGEEELAREINRPTVLSEVIPLKRLAALLAAADLFVAADTGALPLAATLGTPTIGLFGPKDATVYRPHPFDGDVATSPAPCSPCRLRQCEHRICMSLIPPELVCRKALETLERGQVYRAPPAPSEAI
jgi:heptosyltransferase-1